MDLPRIFVLFLIFLSHTFVSIDGQKWGPSSGGNNDNDEDIDFDDLTRRFEALKKKK